MRSYLVFSNLSFIPDLIYFITLKLKYLGSEGA